MTTTMIVIAIDGSSVVDVTETRTYLDNERWCDSEVVEVQYSKGGFSGVLCVPEKRG